MGSLGRWLPRLLLGLVLACGGAAAAWAVGSGSDFSSEAGSTYSGQVATVSGESSASDVTVEWGDGTRSAGGVQTTATTPTRSGQTYDFSLTGDHAYAAPGTYTVGVHATVSGQPQTYTSTGTVTAPKPGEIHASGTPVSAAQARSTGPVTVATFSDSKKGTAAGDYSAAVNWGDGKISGGQVVAAPSGYNVVAGHRYFKPGTFTVVVSIAADDGRTASASTQATVAPVSIKLNPPVMRGLSAPSRVRVGKKATYALKSSGGSKVAMQVWNWGDKAPVDHRLGKDVKFSGGEPVKSTGAQTHKYAKAGPKTVTVTSYGVDGSSTKSVTVIDPGNQDCGDPIPPTPVAHISVINYGPDPAFEFDARKSTQGENACGAATISDHRKFKWDYGDGDSDTEPHIFHTYSKYNTTFTVKLTVTSPYGSKTVTTHVHTEEARCEPFFVKEIPVATVNESCMIPTPLGDHFGFVSDGAINLNGVILSRKPKGSRHILVDEETGTVATYPLSAAQLYATREGDVGTGKPYIATKPDGFGLHDPDSSGTDLVNFAPNPDYKVGGLSLSGPIGVAFHNDKPADVVARAQPPNPLTGGDFPIPLDVSPGQDIDVYPPDLYFGPLLAHNLHFLRHSNGAMEGTGGLTIPVVGDLNAGFSFVAGGVFSHADAAYDPDPPIPVFPLFELNHIGAGFYLKPTMIEGDAGINSTVSVADYSLFNVNGCFNILLASAGDKVHSWCNDKGKPVGNFKEPSGVARLHMTGAITAFGDNVSVGNGYVDASVEGVKVHGHASASVRFPGDFELASASADIDGQVDNSGNAQVSGGGEVCAFEECKGGSLLMSTVGVAGCLPIEFNTYVFGSYTLNMGGWARWDLGDGGLVFAGCDVHDTDHVAIFNRLGSYFSLRSTDRAAVFGGTTKAPVELSKKSDVQIIEATGQTDDPNLKVTGPDGKTYTDTGKTAVHKTEGYAFLHVGTARKTFFVLLGGATGKYHLDSLTGQPMVRVASGRGLDQPNVSGDVSGSGNKRSLKYKADLDPGDKLVFFEVSGSAVRRIEGAKRGGGAVTFTPALAGAGSRSVYAYVTRNGIPRKRIFLDKFEAPAPQVIAPGQVSAKVSGSKLVVAWTGAAGATGYEVDVKLSDGRDLRIRTSAGDHNATVANVLPNTKVAASVITLGSAGRRSSSTAEKIVAPDKPLGLVF